MTCFLISPSSPSRHSTQCNYSSATTDRGLVFPALWSTSMTARWCYRQKSFSCGGIYIWRCWSQWVITHWLTHGAMIQTIVTTPNISFVGGQIEGGRTARWYDALWSNEGCHDRVGHRLHPNQHSQLFVFPQQRHQDFAIWSQNW